MLLASYQCVGDFTLPSHSQHSLSTLVWTSVLRPQAEGPRNTDRKAGQSRLEGGFRVRPQRCGATGPACPAGASLQGALRRRGLAGPGGEEGHPGRVVTSGARRERESQRVPGTRARRLPLSQASQGLQAHPRAVLLLTGARSRILEMTVPLLKPSPERPRKFLGKSAQGPG